MAGMITAPFNNNILDLYSHGTGQISQSSHEENNLWSCSISEGKPLLS